MFQSYLIYGSSSQNLREKTNKIAKDSGMTLKSNSPDIFLISPTKKSITIDQIRSLKSHIAQKPLKEKYKLIIIENADQLTLEAQNALLKTLEEPPSHALIILEAKNYKSLIPTILSRTVSLKVSQTETKTTHQLLLNSNLEQALLEISDLENPQEFLDEQIVSLTQLLADAIRANQPKSAIIGAIEKCLETKKMIDANVNPKFALANLIFYLNL